MVRVAPGNGSQLGGELCTTVAVLLQARHAAVMAHTADAASSEPVRARFEPLVRRVRARQCTPLVAYPLTVPRPICSNDWAEGLSQAIELMCRLHEVCMCYDSFQANASAAYTKAVQRFSQAAARAQAEAEAEAPSAAAEAPAITITVSGGDVSSGRLEIVLPRSFAVPGNAYPGWRPLASRVVGDAG